MSEHNDLFKYVIFIGLILFFATIVTYPWVYVGQPIPPNSTWGQFSSQAENFPQFQNPFDNRQRSELFPAADGNITPAKVVNADPGNVSDCTNSSTPVSGWFGCLQQRDGAKSFAETDNTHFQFSVNLSDAVGGSGASSVVTLIVESQCRAIGGSPVPTKVDFVFVRTNGSVFEFAQYLWCSPGTFQNVTLTEQFTALPLPTLADYSAASVVLAPEGPFDVAFSYLHVALQFTDPQCNPADTLGYIGCLFGQGLRMVFNGVLFFVNGLVFVGQVVFWFVGIVAIFFVALGSIFTGNFGGASPPPIIAGLFGIFVIGIIFVIAFIFMSRIRGTGGAVG